MVVGLLRPDAGRITIDGKDVSGLPMFKRARAGLGYLAQEPSIFRRLSVQDNLNAILEHLPLSPEDRNEKRETLLADLGLTKLARQMAYTLSGGEKRRTEIARAW
jgi:lipopolysaccharide export system ATP-binding protein